MPSTRCPAATGALSIFTKSQGRSSEVWKIIYLARFTFVGMEGLMVRQGGDSGSRFAKYVEGLARVMGHADRTGPLRDYCTGLILPGERKSVEPMAARTAPGRTACATPVAAALCR